MRERIAIAPNGRASRMSVRPVETLSGARVITADEVERWNAFAFDPGGAGRNLDLPAEESSAGVYLWVANKADAAEILTIRNDAGGTITTTTQNESAFLWCDGTAWFVLAGAVST